MDKTFAIKHRVSGLFMAGFRPDGSVFWSTENDATRLDLAGAKQQALLLACHGIQAQKKPVTVRVRSVA